MSNVEIREPKQKRSIEKKKKIIKAGFDLFCEKGYYNTNTAEIAKAAGVSTGIVYNYFKNKKDILIESLQYFSDSIFIPMFDKLNSIDNLSDFSNLLNEIIDSLVESHVALKSAYKEMLAMSNLDEDVENFYKNCEITCINLIVSWLQKNNIKLNNPYEKVHIAFNIIENYCHEFTYGKNENLDYNIMKKECIDIITFMLSK